MHIKKVNLAIVVEGDQKAPFSIATTPRALLLSLDWTIVDAFGKKKYICTYIHMYMYIYTVASKTKGQNFKT